METHAIVMIDSEGVIQFWSSGAEKLFGHDAASALGQTLDLIVPEGHRDRHWAGYKAALAHGGTKIDQPAANIPVLCRDGTVTRFAGRLIFLRDAANESLGAVGIFAPTADQSLPDL